MGERRQAMIPGFLKLATLFLVWPIAALAALRACGVAVSFDIAGYLAVIILLMLFSPVYKEYQR
jgi:hypothetical protein